MAQLTDTEHQMLQFEKHWWKFAGAKDAAIRAHWDISPTLYYARLHALIRRPEAWAAEPTLVKRLRALEEARRAVRQSRAS